MTRRTFVALSSGAILRAGQGDFPGTPYRDYSQCLPDFLRGLAAEAYARRSAEVAGLTSPDAIRARQSWARQTFWNLAGGMPQRTPLDAKTVGQFERAGYRVEKLVYESRPGFWVSANLYVPAGGGGPFPGVLFQLGHSRNGKAYDSYQRCCQGLVKLGFVVLAFDPIGQGERVCYPGSDPSSSRFDSVDDEHTMAGRQMLLCGDTMTRLQLWDAVRSLDVLAAHPLVDAKRLASAGQSGGATLTMLLACVDDRLAAAVVASGNTENFACAGFNPPGSTDDAEQNLIGSAPHSFDRWDLLYPFAPKPLLVMVSDKDFFGTYSPSYLSSGREEYARLRRVYEILGRADSLAWADSPLPHGLAYDARLRLYNWLLRALKPDARPVEAEPPTAPEPERTLWVTETGSVVRSLGSLTPFRMNREQAGKSGPADLARLLAVARPRAGAAFRTLSRVPSRQADVEAVEVESDRGVWVPAWVFLPRPKGGSGFAYLLLEPGGRNGRWREDELYQNFAAAGSPVCVPDLRGIGDLAPEFGRGAAAYTRDHQNEENYAWASLILGRPMLGQWVTDVLAAAAAFRSHAVARNRRLIVAASGKLTVPALIAASLDPGISALYLAGGLVSFQSVVETENYLCSLANFVPSLVRHTDLPEIAGRMAGRKLVLAGAPDGAGARMDTAAVRSLYPGAEAVADARWDAEAIARASA